MKIDNYVIIASLQSEPTCSLINRIPGSHLLISSLPGSALITHASASILEALPCKLDIKRHSHKYSLFIQSPSVDMKEILDSSYKEPIVPGWLFWPQGYKTFSCSAQLSTKYQLLIKTKIPTNKEVSCFKSLSC